MDFDNPQYIKEGQGRSITPEWLINQPSFIIFSISIDDTHLIFMLLVFPKNHGKIVHEIANSGDH